MSDEKDYLETSPLAGDSDIDDTSDSRQRHDATRQRHKSQRSVYLALITALVVITSTCSGLLGAYLGRRTGDLDPTCAAYTTQYCESDLAC
jgi:hypothetical protein